VQQQHHQQQQLQQQQQQQHQQQQEKCQCNDVLVKLGQPVRISAMKNGLELGAVITYFW